MNLLPFTKDPATSLDAVTLDEVLAKAETYGRPQMFKMDSGKWHVNIKFPTIAGTTLEAASKFDHNSIIDALKLAIERAEEIRRAFR